MAASPEITASQDSAAVLEPIAIIGMGCRFPGGADSPAKFWNLLTKGTDAIVDIPAERWAVDRFYHADTGKPSKMYMRKGGFLRERIDEFDPIFFGISPREAAYMDPQQRLLLEVTWEALEDAGLIPKQLAGSLTGVYVGAFTLDSMVLQLSPLNRENLNSHYGAAAASMTMLANRVSYIYDFHGPSVSLDTACSSSLVSFHYACQGLWNRECTLALAGGVNVMLIPEFPVLMSKGHFLAADGHCKTFDERADGYARGEGCGLVVLKPLSAALRDGDEIYAVVRGTGVNQDGRTEGITVPSAAAQESLIREVYRRANIDPKRVVYVEAHGTGTPVGDPIEASVLGRTVGGERKGSGPCVVGSVKANIGHLEAAAGVAGVMKAALCLHHGQIPPQIHVERPNPNIPFAEYNLRLPAGLEFLPKAEGNACVGVNSFGYGGTNAHAVLEQAPPRKAPAHGPEVESRPYLLPLSARSEESLRALAQTYAEWLSTPDAPPVRDVCYSAGTRRSHLEHRVTITANSPSGLIEQLTAFAAGARADNAVAGKVAAGQEPQPVFVFTGMGPQWWAMGRELLAAEPVFRRAAEECDGLFQRLAGWSILAAMTADEAQSRMAETKVAQPANFLLQVALTALWRSWGVEPAAVVGHSVGEAAAAYVSGALDLPDAVRVIYHRSRLQQTTSGMGRMLAVSLSPEAVEPWLEGREHQVSIAAVNSATSVTLSGDPAPLEELAAEFERRGIFSSFLRVTVAYHSPHMDRLEQELKTSLRDLRPKAPSVPLYSTVTGGSAQDTRWDAAYWYRNIRQPVIFAGAMDRLVEEGYSVFLEVGPHPVLAASISECLMRHELRGEVIPSLRRKEPEGLNLAKAVGRLYAAGYAVDWQKLQGGSRRYVRLPNYAWKRERYWSESERNAACRVAQPVHPLLGMRLAEAGQNWESELTAHYLTYLNDHVVDGMPLLPGAAYVEGGLALHKHLDGGDAAVIEDLELLRALSLSAPNELLLLGWQFDEKTRKFQVQSRPLTDGSRWTLHAQARISPAPPSARRRLDMEEIKRRCGSSIEPDRLYPRMRAYGLQYGPAFQTIRCLYQGASEVLARLELARELDASGYHLHPSLLDGSFQSLIACVDAADAGTAHKVYVPVRIRAVRYHAPAGASCWCYSRLTRVTEKSIEGDIVLCSETGEVLAEVQGFCCAALHPAHADSAKQLQPWAYTLRWEPADPVQPKPLTGRWLLFNDDGGLGADLATRLRAAGAAEVLEIAPAQEHGGLQHLLRVADVRDCQAVVYLRGLDDSRDAVGTPAAMDALELVQALAACDAAPRLYIVTRGAQQVNPDEPVDGLSQSALVGLARVVASEQPNLHCTLIDIDRGEGVQQALTAELTAASDENEIALRGRARYKQRFIRAIIKELEESATARRLVPPAAEKAFTLEIGKRGSLDSLRYRQVARRQPGPGEVEVRIQATALNFKDVLKVLGVLSDEAYEHTFYEQRLGMEAAGVVTAIGEGVTECKVGDRFVGAIRDAFSSHSYARAESLVFRPDGDMLTAAEAAASPIAFLTAYYGLHKLAQLSRGESVLIHAATGGVGLAAIQVARWLGAEIYATAGSPAKREYLRSLGVQHIWDSRSLDFAEGILAATNGRGVDVVLNSISGEALLKSVSVLAPYGRFIEIGKRDIVENTGLPMLPFNRNLSFTAIDLDRMMLDRPGVIRRLLQEVWERMDAGDFRPLPTRVFRAAEICEAFRYMAQSKQMGKIVVDMENAAGVSLHPTVESEKPIKTDATYLITGGFGGIGLELAKGLADQGARNLVLVGRKGAASEKAKRTVQELESRGISVLAAAKDISQPEQVADLLAEIARIMPPLKGIFHAAAVLDDGLLTALDAKRFARVMEPKARGAWLLHQYTCSLPLDFFVLFSSVSAWVGNPGQGSYAAANTFIEALAQHRRAQGLPATCIAWGAVGDAGMVAENQQVAQHLAVMGIHPIPVASVVGAIPPVLRWDPVQLGIMEVDWSRWKHVHPLAKTAPRFSYLLAEAENDGQALDSHGIRAALAALPPAKRVDRLATGLVKIVADALRMPAEKVDLHQPFADMGLDSLLGVELQTAMSINLGVEVSVLELMKAEGILGLAKDLLVKMKVAPAESEGAGGPHPAVLGGGTEQSAVSQASH